MEDAHFNGPPSSKSPWTSWNPKTRSFTLLDDGVPTQVSLTEYVSPAVDISILRDEMTRRTDYHYSQIATLFNSVRDIQKEIKSMNILKDADLRIIKVHTTDIKNLGNQFLQIDEKVGRFKDKVKDDSNKVDAKLASLSEGYEMLHKKMVKQKAKIKEQRGFIEELARALQETRDALDFLPGNLTFLEAKQHFSELLKDGAYVCEQTMGRWEEGTPDGEVRPGGDQEGWGGSGSVDEGTEKQEREEGEGKGDEEASVHSDNGDSEDDLNSGTSDWGTSSSDEEEEDPDGYYCLSCQEMHYTGGQ